MNHNSIIAFFLWKKLDYLEKMLILIVLKVLRRQKAFGFLLWCIKIKLNIKRYKIAGDSKMSQHPSLRVGGKIRQKRNVLKRFERLDVLKADGRWKDGDKVLGLPKTKSDV